MTYSSSSEPSESEDAADENVTPPAKKPRKEENSRSVDVELQSLRYYISNVDHVIYFLYLRMYYQCFLMKM